MLKKSLILILLAVHPAYAGGYSVSSTQGASRFSENPTPEEVAAIAPSAGAAAAVAADVNQMQTTEQKKRPAPLPAALRLRAAAEAQLPHAVSAWARPVHVGRSVAVYLTMTGGAAHDRLIGVKTAWAGAASLRETLVGDKDYVRTNVVTVGVALPAQSRVTLAPRGTYIMLSQMQRGLRAGQMFPLILFFEKAGAVRVMVQVTKDP